MMTTAVKTALKAATTMTITAAAAAVADRQLVHRGLAFWGYDREGDTSTCVFFKLSSLRLSHDMLS